MEIRINETAQSSKTQQMYSAVRKKHIYIDKSGLGN